MPSLPSRNETLAMAVKKTRKVPISLDFSSRSKYPIWDCSTLMLYENISPDFNKVPNLHPVIYS